MQIMDKIKDCNGCSACIVGCKDSAIKMQYEGEKKFPLINEGACNKCNNCVLYCPLYMPVELPKLEEFYEYNSDFYHRDMPKIYRQTMRDLRDGKQVDFVGTLCQIAGLKSLMGDRLHENLSLKPLYCDPENPEREECRSCEFIGQQY